jgi:hypothetical protein
MRIEKNRIIGICVNDNDRTKCSTDCYWWILFARNCRDLEPCCKFYHMESVGKSRCEYCIKEFGIEK